MRVSKYEELAKSIFPLSVKEMLATVRAAEEIIRDISLEVKNAQSAAKCALHLRAFQSELQEIMDRINAHATKLNQEILPALYEQEEVSTITLHGYRVSAREDYKASIIASNKTQAFEWLEKNGYAEIIDTTPRVNANTLSALYKDLMSNGDVLPEELFRVYQFNNTSITKVL